MDTDDKRFVSRGGLKLEHALKHFQLDVTDRICADLGCSTGGFSDCLLQHDARHVFSVDTAYGEFAWALRNDPRITLLERTNAIHFNPPRPRKPRTLRKSDDQISLASQTKHKPKTSRKVLERFQAAFDSAQANGGVSLVVIDLGWTKQSLALPAALRWLGQDAKGQPTGDVVTLIKPHYEVGEAHLSDEKAQAVTQQVLVEIQQVGWQVQGSTPSPIAGGKGGNREFLVWLKPSIS